MCRYFFSIVLFVFWTCSYSQAPVEEAGTSVEVEQPKKKKDSVDWKPSIVRVGVDAASLFATFLDQNRKQVEAMAEVDFGNWFLVGEVGSAIIDRGETYRYRSDGNYWRIGLDKNLTPQLTEGHVVSAGFRYARSSFDEQIILSDGFTAANSALEASWIELTTGIRMKVWKQLFIGYQMRIKGFKRLSDENGPLQTYDIPGFGRNKKSGNTVRNGAFGFSYYVYWTIPFREKQRPK